MYKMMEWQRVLGVPQAPLRFFLGVQITISSFPYPWKEWGCGIGFWLVVCG